MIGIFDSGVGGLTILKTLRERAPQADIVYFGDTEHAPYGARSARDIAELVAMALRRLHAEGATNIICACNSASAALYTLPIDPLRLRIFNVIEMIDPTVAALDSQKKKIAVLATKATIRSGMYQQAFLKRGITVTPVAIPELAAMIEAGASHNEILPMVRAAIEEALAYSAEILALSCTHYPLVRDVFEECLQEKGVTAAFFDPAKAVAEEALHRFSAEGRGTLKFLVSKETPVFSAYVNQLFGSVPHTLEVAGSIFGTFNVSR